MTTTRKKRESFKIQGHTVAPGTQEVINLPVGVFTNHTPVDLSVVVVHGRRPGPTLLVTACVHGDEINGSEIIRRLLKTSSLKGLRGTLLAVPILNVPAFLNRSRYLPDRRDLNRLFPGSSTGSLGSRLARVVSEELIPRCDAVVDLHTGAVNRANLPQVRVTSGDESSLELARVFHAPVILQAPLRPNAFRTLCRDNGKPMILFESGEALRLDTPSIRHGLQGILGIMRHLDLLPKKKNPPKQQLKSVICKKSYWERAPIGGLFTPLIPLGITVETGATLGFVADPFGGDEHPVVASHQGVVIGRTNEGLADEGDALFHIALFSDLDRVRDQISQSNQALPDTDPDLDDHPVPYDPFTEETSPSED
ncbi:MAG: putative deacylase [Paracoccaceae bacterium]|jgi:predicted deacylase